MSEKDYDKPSYYYGVEQESTAGRLPPEDERVIYRRVASRKHGVHLRGGFMWIIWSIILLAFPLYVKAVGLSLYEWSLWISAIGGFFSLMCGAMIVVGEWRKGDK